MEKKTMEKNVYCMPSPMLDEVESKSLEELVDRYNKLLEPGVLNRAGKVVLKMVPEGLKKIGKDAINSISCSGSLF